MILFSKWNLVSFFSGRWWHWKIAGHSSQGQTDPANNHEETQETDREMDISGDDSDHHNGNCYCGWCIFQEQRMKGMNVSYSNPMNCITSSHVNLHMERKQTV